MPDLDEMEREEQAFREAFERHADAYRPVKVDPYVPVRRPRRPAWAAVAAVVVLIGAGLGTLVHVQYSHSKATPASQNGRGVQTSCVDDCVPSSLPKASAGWRWVSWHDVAVQVPDSWGWGSGPNGFTCVTKPPKPDTPYVSVDTTYELNGLVGCAGSAPADLPKEMADADPGVAEPADWRPNIAFGTVPRSYPESYLEHFGTWHYGGWTFTRRIVGGTSAVALLTRDSDAATAARVLASARTFAIDQDGCPDSSPIQAQRHVRPKPGDSDVVSVSVCQYDRHVASGEPGLMGSQLLTGRQATDLVDAIEAAPAGGGPDDPSDCLHPYQGDTAVELIAHGDTNGGERVFYVYYDSCSGNGIDDGTTLHRLTSADCPLIFYRLPVTLYRSSQDVSNVCYLRS